LPDPSVSGDGATFGESPKKRNMKNWR
jgi:hypothetical protein